MKRTGIEVEGLNQVVRGLKRTGDNSEDLKKAFKTIATRGAQESKARAPRRSGALAASVRPANRSNAAVINAGNARVPYAGPIHWGWPRRNITAQPFIVETAASLESWAVRQMLDDIGRIARANDLNAKGF